MLYVCTNLTTFLRIFYVFEKVAKTIPFKAPKNGLFHKYVHNVHDVHDWANDKIQRSRSITYVQPAKNTNPKNSKNHFTNPQNRVHYMYVKKKCVHVLANDRKNYHFFKNVYTKLSCT